MPDLSAAVHLAKSLGPRLGARALLFGALPALEGITPADLTGRRHPRSAGEWGHVLHPAAPARRAASSRYDRRPPVRLPPCEHPASDGASHHRHPSSDAQSRTGRWIDRDRARRTTPLRARRSALDPGHCDHLSSANAPELCFTLRGTQFASLNDGVFRSVAHEMRVFTLDRSGQPHISPPERKQFYGMQKCISHGIRTKPLSTMKFCS